MLLCIYHVNLSGLVPRKWKNEQMNFHSAKDDGFAGELRVLGDTLLAKLSA